MNLDKGNVKSCGQHLKQGYEASMKILKDMQEVQDTTQIDEARMWRSGGMEPKGFA